jgi:hypothetical protein
MQPRHRRPPGVPPTALLWERGSTPIRKADCQGGRASATVWANLLREGARRGKLRMLLAQFTEFMILLLIAAAIVLGIVGDTADAAVILGIMVRQQPGDLT